MQKYWDKDLNISVLGKYSFARIKILNSLSSKPKNKIIGTYNFTFGIIVSKDLDPYFLEKNYIPEMKIKGGPQNPGIEKSLEEEFFWI